MRRLTEDKPGAGPARPCALALMLALAAVYCAGFASPQARAADPLSDNDGDGIPYQWEAAQPVALPQGATTGAKPPRCTSKQRLRKRHCARKCKKGRKLKGRKCVKKKHAKQRGAKARAAAATAATVSVAPLGADPNHKDIFVQIN